jgi:hypothetical protein
MTLEDHFWKNVDKTGDCWIWMGTKHQRGYGFFFKAGNGVLAHRWIMGATERTQFVCHKCDNPSCVRPDHLTIGTARHNTQDSIRKGRFCQDHWFRKGVNHKHAKLTEEQVLEVKMSPRGWGVAPSLARKFGVDSSTIKAIWEGRSWKHVFP